MKWDRGVQMSVVAGLLELADRERRALAVDGWGCRPIPGKEEEHAVAEERWLALLELEAQMKERFVEYDEV